MPRCLKKFGTMIGWIRPIIIVSILSKYASLFLPLPALPAFAPNEY
jgi:hypothetical protein